MLELYLIQLFGTINILAIIGSTVFGLIYAGIKIGYFLIRYGDNDIETSNALENPAKKYLICFLVSIGLLTFIPSKEETLKIIGFGTIIDYVQSNDQVKELPDKCVEAISLYIDEYLPKKGK
jgi:hypothetical protein